MGDTSTVHNLLLQEAHQEIASLRTDLYNTRRIAQDRLQAITSTTAERDQLREQLSSCSISLGQCQQQLSQLQGVDALLSIVKQACEKLQRDLELGVQARKILQGELAEERNRIGEVQQAKAMLESDRSRVRKAKDDLAAQLRLAQQQAREAEQEQLHAEEEASALRLEVQALRNSLIEHGTAAGALSNGMNGSLAAAASHSMGDAMRGVAASAAMHHNGRPTPRDASAAELSAAQQQLQALRQQLERERGQAAALLEGLQAAKSEAAALRQQAEAREAHQGGPQPAPRALMEEAVALRLRLDASDARVFQLEEELQAAVEQKTLARQEAAAAAAAIESQQLRSAGFRGQIMADGRSNSVSQTTTSAAGGDAVAASTSGGEASGGRPPRHHRVSSGGASLKATRLSLLAEGEGGDDTELLAELERCQAQVHKLKHSRDKLLEEIDSQWEEMDRLAAEHRAATEDSRTQRRLAASWEAQAQDALAHIDRLKKLLEEIAVWEASPREDDGGGTWPAAVAVEAAATMRLRALHGALLEEKARSTDLELGMRALAAELVRAQHASVAIGRSVLPVLSGMEYRLGDMCSRAREAVASGAKMVT